MILPIAQNRKYRRIAIGDPRSRSRLYRSSANLFDIVSCLDDLLDSVERVSRSMLSLDKEKVSMQNLRFKLNKKAMSSDPEILAMFFSYQEVLSFEGKTII